MYQIGHCFVDLDQMKEFDKTPPSDEEKIWTIAKGETEILIQCNGVRVLSMNFTEKGDTEDCDKTWRPGVTKIRFSSKDTASLCHRKLRTCSFVSNTHQPGPKLIPETVLPILPGAVVTLY